MTVQRPQLRRCCQEDPVRFSEAKFEIVAEDASPDHAEAESSSEEDEPGKNEARTLEKGRRRRTPSPDPYSAGVSMADLACLTPEALRLPARHPTDDSTSEDEDRNDDTDQDEEYRPPVAKPRKRQPTPPPADDATSKKVKKLRKKKTSNKAKHPTPNAVLGQTFTTQATVPELTPPIANTLDAPSLPVS